MNVKLCPVIWGIVLPALISVTPVWAESPISKKSTSKPSSMRGASEKLKPGWGVFKGEMGLAFSINNDGMKEISGLSLGTMAVEIAGKNGKPQTVQIHTTHGQLSYMDDDGKVHAFEVKNAKGVGGRSQYAVLSGDPKDDPLAELGLILTDFDAAKNPKTDYYFGPMKPFTAVAPTISQQFYGRLPGLKGSAPVAKVEDTIPGLGDVWRVQYVLVKNRAVAERIQNGVKNGMTLDKAAMDAGETAADARWCKKGELLKPVEQAVAKLIEGGSSVVEVDAEVIVVVLMKRIIE